LLGIFFVPALFVFIERIGGHKDVAPMATPEAVPDSGAVASGPIRLLGGE
jgi:hypothetical protein